jgi:hypothetical protein
VQGLAPIEILQHRAKPQQRSRSNLRVKAHGSE